MRFACTQCGACCNRSPEVELSEAAPLADVFVFRLMFRLYSLPRNPAHYSGGSNEQFYQSKRLLSSFAAHSSRTKLRTAGKTLEYDRYLIISALAVDGGTGACSALGGTRCGIYERRPLACRTAPLSYSRTDATAEADLRAFVATPGYRCDTSDAAPIVVDRQKIIDPELIGARSEARTIANLDRAWTKAIIRRMRTGCSTLPTFHEVEANARFAATTVPMSLAWRIGVECGIIGEDEYRNLIEVQAATIDRHLSGTIVPSARETLTDMRAEYRELLGAS
jgi:Fe-S-cluster containining protein